MCKRIIYFLILLSISSTCYAESLMDGIENWLEQQVPVKNARAQLNAALEEQSMKYSLLLPFNIDTEFEMSLKDSGVSFDTDVSIGYSFLDADIINDYKKTELLILATEEYLE
ncbi:MAG: hypothetical protein PQJ46_10465 [Spirochaetales bacterium]|nr:hypothetical protein [Spirochaetales bacterium]